MTMMKQSKKDRVDESKALIDAAGGAKTFAHTLWYAGNNIPRHQVKKSDVRKVSQWGQRGIPFKLFREKKAVFDFLIRVVERQKSGKEKL